MSDTRRTNAERNVLAWNNELEPSASKYDSTMKKNLAFVKSIKASLSSEKVSTVLNQIDLLSLHMYLSEITLNIYEGICAVSKYADVIACGEIISRLHQRFHRDFTPVLIANILYGLSNEVSYDSPEVRMERQKNLLRILVELSLLQVARTVQDVDLLIVPDVVAKKFASAGYKNVLILTVVLKDILVADQRDGEYLSVIDKIAHRYYALLDEYVPESSKLLKSLISEYTKRCVKVHVFRAEQLNKEIGEFNYNGTRKGRIDPEAAAQLRESKQQFTGRSGHIEALCKTTDQEFPEIHLKDDIADEVYKKPIISFAEKPPQSVIVWANPDDEPFYTVIPDLDSISITPGENYTRQYKKITTYGDKVTKFIEDLDATYSDKQLLELLSVFKAYNMNNKATQNRLLTYFIDSEKSSSYKYYTKFMKVYESELGDMVFDLVDSLEAKMKLQLQYDRLSFRFIYFYIELIKFKLIPKFKVSHKIAGLSRGIMFSNNLDVLNVIFQRCGPLLYYDVDFGFQMQKSIKLLSRKLQDDEVDESTRSSIKNLLLYVKPKDQVHVTNHKKLDPAEHAFLVKLIRNELDRSTYKRVFKYASIYPLEEPEYADLLVNLYTSYKLMKHDRIAYMMKLLSGLARKKPQLWQSVVGRVIDQVVEDIFSGVELNDFRMNKERSLYMVLLAEMYNEKFLTLGFLIKLCLQVIGIGHPNNQPVPLNYKVELDAPNNFFKIQLICNLFKHINELPTNKTPKNSKAAANEKYLSEFVPYFQYYVFTKERAPLETQFMINDFHAKVRDHILHEIPMDLESAVIQLKNIIEEREKKREPKTKTTTERMDLEIENTDTKETYGDDEVDDEYSSEGEGAMPDMDDSDESDSDDSDDSNDSDDNLEEVDVEVDSDIEENEEGAESEESDVEEDNELETHLDSENSIISDSYGKEITETEFEEHPKQSDFEDELSKSFKGLLQDAYNEPFTAVRNKPIAVPKPTKSGGVRLLLNKNGAVSTKEIKSLDETIRRRLDKHQEQKQLLNNTIIRLVSDMHEE